MSDQPTMEIIPLDPGAQLAAALVEASAEMPVVSFDATNPFLHNRFASLGAVIATARPILAKHGLAIMQFACSDAHGRVGVRTRLIHSSGEFLEETIYLDVSEEKGKSRAQVAGSIITYLRRYAQSSMLNLYADEDTDGNAPDRPPAPTAVPTHPVSKPPSTPTRPPKAATAAPGATGAAKGSAAPNPGLEERCKARFLEVVKEKKWEIFAWDYAVTNGWLLPTEKLDDVPASKVPQTADSFSKFMAQLKSALDAVGNKGVPQELAESYDKAHLELPLATAMEPGEREPWMDVELHFGPQKGTKLIDLDSKKLWGWCKNYTPEPYKGKINEKDSALRKALDNALSWLDQNPDHQGPEDDNVPF